MADRDQSPTSNRGFASMDEKRQRDIASKGGQASGGNFANDPERAADAETQGRPQRACRRAQLLKGS